MKIPVFCGFCVFCDLGLCLLLAAVFQLRMPDGNNGGLAGGRRRCGHNCVLLRAEKCLNLVAALHCWSDK